MGILDKVFGGDDLPQEGTVSSKPKEETGTTPAAAAPSDPKSQRTGASSSISSTGASSGASTSTKTPQDDETPEQKEAQRLALSTAPAEIKEQAERLGGQVPRAAPKGGEGVNPDATRTEFPELQPPIPPTEFRAAPVAPGDEEREKWSGARPTIKELEDADVVEVRTLDPKSAPFFVAGIRVDRFGVKANLAPIIARGKSHVAMLANDLRIEVRIADSALARDDK